MKHYYITNLTNEKALDIQLPWHVRNDKEAIEYLSKVQSQFPNDQLEMALVKTEKGISTIVRIVKQKKSWLISWLFLQLH